MKRRYLSRRRIVFLSILAACYLVHLFTRIFEKFADFVNRTAAFAFRFVMAKFSNLFPFALSEWVIALIPTALLVLVGVGIILGKTKEGRRRFLSFLLSFLLVFYLFYDLGLGIGYRTTPLAEKMGLERTSPTADELEETAKYLLAKTEGLLDGITFTDSGSSVSGMTAAEIDDAICEAYEAFVSEYPIFTSFSSRAKRPTLSRLLSYSHLLGIYTFFTGESNLNGDYPDSAVVSSTAHEFAHQRGIIREDEANFIAFMVCIDSDNAYVRYAGYSETLEYVLNALYLSEADHAKFYAIRDEMDPRIRKEYVAYSEVVARYEDNNPIGTISSAANDLYLKANGTAGVASYGLVTELAVAYVKTLQN